MSRVLNVSVLQCPLAWHSFSIYSECILYIGLSLCCSLKPLALNGFEFPSSFNSLALFTWLIQLHLFFQTNLHLHLSPGGLADLNNSKRHLCRHAGTNIVPHGTFYINLHTNELNTKQTQVAHEHRNPPFFSHLVMATEISTGSGMELGEAVLLRESV